MAPARDPSGCMLWIGAPCFHCKREDFLPLRCLACECLFCAEHFGQEAHACPHPARDMLVPLCPLCEEPPRGWRRDMPTDELSSLMESHWTAPALDRGGCRALVSRRSGASRRCCVDRCQEKVLVPIKVRRINSPSAHNVARACVSNTGRPHSMRARARAPHMRQSPQSRPLPSRWLLPIPRYPRRLRRPHPPVTRLRAAPP